VLSAAAVYPLWAADVETQHAFDVTLPLKPTLELILHSRVRTQPGGLGIYQARAGPIASWDAAPRMTLLSGYYYARQERKIDNDFIGGHRLFGGAEIAVVETRRFSIDQRLLAERFLSDAAADFNRYRLRSRLSAKGSVAPTPATSSSLTPGVGGATATPPASDGVCSRPCKSTLATCMSTARPEVGPGPHMWLNSIHWKKSSRWADPDL
jgi:hypothetical protein